MNNQEIEEFARILVQKVRDSAIQSCDSNLRPDARNPIAKRWQKAGESSTSNDFAKVLIPDIVDSTISHLLGAIDQEMLRLLFIASNGKSVDLNAVAEDSGELSGWYKGGGGWIEKHSKERVVDDFTDLHDFFNKS